MRCPKCGKTLDASAKICPVCRTQIASASEHSSTNVNTNHRPNTTPARAVVEPSGSVGGTGTHRCPKCGKTLDASAKICPVCHTHLVSASEHSSTNVNTNHRPNTAPARAVVEPSGSVGGSGTHRCPKCGKTLDASAKICPVCRTQIASASEHSSTNVNTNHRPNTAPARAVVEPSASAGGSGTHRCPKCGKALDASAKICPVCRTQIASVSAHSSTVNSSGYAQRQPEPAVDRHQPVNINPSAYAESAQPQSSKKRSKKPVAIAVAIASAAAVIAIAVIGLNLFKKDNDKDEGGIQTSDSPSYETVDSKLSEVLSDPGDDSEKLRQQVGTILDDLEKDGLVKDAKYVDQTGMYEFTYDDGTQGGVMLKPFSEDTKGVQKDYAKKDGNGKVVSYDNRVDLDKSKYTYSQNPKAKIMYGLGMPKTLSDMKKRNEVWESEGLAVDIDEECTVEDFAKDLKGYDYIEIDEHGTIYDDVPVICLEEYATKENREKYSKDLKAHNIILTKVRDADPYKSYYWIKPSFFKEHYGSKGLSGSIIYLGCCRGYMKKDLVEAIKGAGADTVLGYSDSVYADYDYYIQDTFVYSLMCGDNVSESLKYAKSTWGKNDADWYKLYSGRNKTDYGPAELKLYGDSQKTLVKIKSAETTTATTKKPEEKPVPDKIKEMLEYTEPDYRGQPGGPAAAFMTYYGYRGHEGTMQDEMWFQDMDGDNIPDLVVGGYSAIVDGIQGRTHCFQIQLSKGNGGGTIHLLLDYSSKDKHGHDAFMMQAYKDNNGSLLFTHTDFYAYTSPDPERDPKYAGAFTIYEYSFAKEFPEKNKKKILYYTYNPKLGSGEDAFSCSDSNGSRITAANAKKLFNNYYASKTPLKANIKTINYQNYMNNMSQEQRKQALMDSYYAFSYTENKSIAPYGKEVFDKMPSAATTTTTTSKPQDNVDNIYASYSAILSNAKNRKTESNNVLDISYMVFDYDRDGKDELIIHYLTGARIGEAVIYEYDSKSGKSVLEAEGPCGSGIEYSKKIGSLVTTSISNAPVKPNSPSGASVVICKIIVSGKEISYEGIAQLDPDLDKKQIDEYLNGKTVLYSATTNGSADAVKANAVKNKAA